MGDYPHLTFSNNWNIGYESIVMLGECKALINSLKQSPLTPEVKNKLQLITLKKGALSTTAIEGNSVTEEEYDKFISGESDLPQSRKYQQVEVQNMVDAMNAVLQMAKQGKRDAISIDLILSFHEMVMKNLENYAETTPGRFRESEVYVGTYRPPDHMQIANFMNKYCAWLSEGLKEYDICDTIIKAFIAHVYFEWIHPFGDGNGRTGRLIEYYILMRGGFPVIAGHLTSNFYNNTRGKYYKYLDMCRKKQDLTEFLCYALAGLRDGLYETASIVAKSQVAILWKQIIYDTFAKAKKGSASARTEQLILNFPLNIGLHLNDIPHKTGMIEYAKYSRSTLHNDIKKLVSLGLLYQKEKIYYANYKIIAQEYFTLNN